MSYFTTTPTKLLITQVVMFTTSLGFIGWMIYYFGLMDIVVHFVITIGTLVPIMMVIFGVMSEGTYNRINEDLTEHYLKIMAELKARTSNINS